MLSNALRLPIHSCRILKYRQVHTRIYYLTPSLNYRQHPYFTYQQRRGAHGKHAPEQDCVPPPKGKAKFYLATTVLLTSAVIGYAKYDDEFRAWLNDNVPYSNDVIKFVFQEDNNILEYISKGLDYVKEGIIDLINTMFSHEVKKTDDKKEKRSPGALPPCDEEQKPYRPPRSAFKPLLTEEKKEDVMYTERRKLLPPVPPAKETVITPLVEGSKAEDEAQTESTRPDMSDTQPKTLVELEESIGSAARIAIRSYTEAICALRDQAEDIYKLVEDSVEKVDPKIWPQLKIKSDEKEKLIKEAEMNAKIAEESIDRLLASVDNPRLSAPPEMKERAKKNMSKVIKDVADARTTFEKERAKASVTDKYWSKVEEARKHFSEELELLFPNVRLTDKNLKLSEGEIDLFILYAFQNILYYQKELSRLDTVGELRVKTALEQSKSGDPQIIQSAVEAELDKEKRKIVEDFQKKTLSLKAECERDIRTQLKRQAEAHSQHLQEAVILREKEVERKIQRKIEEKLIEERTKFKEELAGLIGRIKGLDEAIKKRSDTDKNAQQSQVLWSACQTLVTIVQAADFSRPWTEQLRPINAEVTAISKAGENDDLVEAVIATIPQEALTRGIYPQGALRERFLKVERVASVLSIVPEGGASLPLIFLSYLQSFFMIKNPLPIPAYELANDPIDADSLNTYDILQRARYWMERGDFVQTLRYMNLLKGAPRAIAKDWVKEVQIMLETIQAANTLLTHASAIGLAS